ncbi:MAG: hypothetical protein ACLGSD_04020 [Acidobacteriota bacterium]
MSPVPKMNQEPPPEPIAMPGYDVVQNMAGTLLKGVERLAEIQKQTLSLAVQQNTEMAAVVKKAAEKLPIVPRLAFLDLAVGTFDRYAEAQKQAIDFALEQSKLWTDLFKERSRLAKDVSDSNNKAFKRSIESTLAANKKGLDAVAVEAKAAVDAVREQVGLGGPQVVTVSDSFKKGIDTVVDAQKELLELVAR